VCYVFIHIMFSGSPLQMDGLLIGILCENVELGREGGGV